jgi:anti-sigma regulatory factor (Ser/Thr protein kinase)
VLPPLAEGQYTEGSDAVPFKIPPGRSLPLPPPPSSASSFTYRDDLSRVRALVLARALGADLTRARANDLVLAVSEVAANTLRHTSDPGTLTMWHDDDEIVCEVHDEGVITDPLAGRRRPAPDAAGGHGLWLVYQVCDLVELRSGTDGTTIRMHMDRQPGLPPLANRRRPSVGTLFGLPVESGPYGRTRVWIYSPRPSRQGFRAARPSRS